MNSQDRYPTASRWLTLVSMALLASAGAVGAPAPTERGLYDRLSSELLETSLFVDGSAEPGIPTDSEHERAAAAGRDTAAQAPSGTQFAASGALAFTGELGASDRFAGGGSGMEVQLGIGRRSGWRWSVGFSWADGDLYSVVDRAPAAIERYLLGASRSWAVRRRMRLKTGGGVAWNRITIEGKEPELDVDGPGAFLELGFGAGLGTHLEASVDGRLIYWQGTDGFGNTGDELSAMLGIRLIALF